MHLKILKESNQSSTDHNSFHLHVLNTPDRSYYIFSNKDQMAWENFLVDGLLDSQVKRLIEVSRDEWGATKIVRDLIR
jgi:hypothetical protein